MAGSAILGHQLGSSTAKPATSPAKHLTVVDPYATGGIWYKGNLHVASARGVGKDLPKALGAWYAAHGYAFLGISDMNTYTWPEEYGSRSLPGVPTVGATYPFADLLEGFRFIRKQAIVRTLVIGAWTALRARSSRPPKCWRPLEIPTTASATSAKATNASLSQRGTTQVRFSSMGMPE